MATAKKSVPAKKSAPPKGVRNNAAKKGAAKKASPVTSKDPNDPGENPPIDFKTLWRLAYKHNQKPAGNNTAGPTWFAHFPMAALLHYFADTAGIDPTTTSVDALIKMTNPAYGLKAYFIQHLTKEDSPHGDARYVGSNSLALVVTKSGDQGSTWTEVTETPKKGAQKNRPLVAGATVPGLESLVGALDRTELYPPGSGITFESDIDPTKDPDAPLRTVRKKK